MGEETKKEETTTPSAKAEKAPQSAASGSAESAAGDAPATASSGPRSKESAAAEAPVKKAKKKGKRRTVVEARVSIQATYNNTIVSVTDMGGNVLCWASSGSCGFKGTRKATPYASSVAADTALTKAKVMGVERVHISVRGTGSGRDQAIRAVNASGVSIESIKDVTAIPHNGCRARKARRV